MGDQERAALYGSAWARFCDELKASGQKVLDFADDDLDRVEGFRYLSRLARGGLESFLEHGDIEFPTVPALPHMLKIGCDNPDAHYQRVTIDPRRTYRLWGPWEESLDYRFLSVTVNQHTAHYEPDGSVRIVVGHQDPGAGNWMDTAGHHHGTMGLRWNQAVTDVVPTCRVIPLGDLTT